MIETIKFKPEYEKELIRLGVKTRFLRNRIERCNESGKYIHAIDDLDTFQKFILNAFIWEDTPEGHSFWEQVSNNIKPEKL